MENLGIDTRLLIAQLINFGLLFFIFKRFIASPFKNCIEGEKNKEQEQNKLLDDLKKQEEQLVKQSAKLKEELKSESKKIISEAKESAEKIKAQILADASSEGEEIRAKAKKQTIDEKDDVLKELKEKVVELSFFVVNKTLGEVLSEDSKKKITQKMLKNLTETKINHEN